MPERVTEFPFVKYSDGGFEVFGNEDGLPRVEAVIPAPDINHKSDSERENTHKLACDGITLQGYLITSKRLVRNKAFDGPGQKTTLKIIFRPCKNKDEMLLVSGEIKRILDEKLVMAVSE